MKQKNQIKMKQKNYLKLIIVTVFFTLCYVKSTAQTGTISGVITDDYGLYVPGANVYIESIKRGTVSDFNGRFTLVQVPIGNQDLKITYLGYADVAETVEVIKGKTTGLVFLQDLLRLHVHPIPYCIPSIW